MKRRGKTVALWTGALCVVVLVAVGFAARDTLIERWSRWQRDADIAAVLEATLQAWFAKDGAWFLQTRSPTTPIFLAGLMPIKLTPPQAGLELVWLRDGETPKQLGPIFIFNSLDVTTDRANVSFAMAYNDGATIGAVTVKYRLEKRLNNWTAECLGANDP